MFVIKCFSAPLVFRLDVLVGQPAPGGCTMVSLSDKCQVHMLVKVSVLARVHTCVCVCVCLSVCLSVCACVCVSVCPYLCLSVCLRVLLL